MVLWYFGTSIHPSIHYPVRVFVHSFMHACIQFHSFIHCPPPPPPPPLPHRPRHLNQGCCLCTTITIPITISISISILITIPHGGVAPSYKRAGYFLGPYFFELRLCAVVGGRTSILVSTSSWWVDSKSVGVPSSPLASEAGGTLPPPRREVHMIVSK